MNIDEATVLIFDMDGTLIDTDLANFLSYKDAIQSIIGLDHELILNPTERFNRMTLKTVLPNLTESEYRAIIKRKEEKYERYLPKTKLNEMVFGILKKYYKSNRTVLVTNCRKNRALLTLEYHNLKDKFNDLLFRQSSNSQINKYKNAISTLSLSTQNIVVFENENKEIKDAESAGISTNNIIRL